MQQQGIFDISKASDAEILSTIDEANRRGFSINLNIPATDANIKGILSSISCRRCGLCCSTGTCPDVRQNGIPILNPEIINIANYLNIRPRKVRRLCFVNDTQGYSLPYPCPFHKISPSQNCSIYTVRPITCQMFPLYSIMENNDISIDAGCPEARDFTLKHFQSIREALKRQI